MGDVIFQASRNRQLLDGGAMFEMPKMWERWFKPDNLNRIELACRALLVQSDDKNILLETGIGAFLNLSLPIDMA